MIRLRIERFTPEEMEQVFDTPLGYIQGCDGLIWFGEGIPRGRVVIEQYVPPHSEDYAIGEWEPVEVIDET